jgi:hypothetical protein
VEYLPSILGAVALQAPVYLIWLGGILLAILTWRKNPRVSLLSVIALALLLLNSILGTVLNSLIPIMMQRSGMDFRQFGMISLIRGLLQTVIACVAWILVLAAVFGWRKQQNATPA